MKPVLGGGFETRLKFIKFGHWCRRTLYFKLWKWDFVTKLSSHISFMKRTIFTYLHNFKFWKRVRNLSLFICIYLVRNQMHLLQILNTKICHLKSMIYRNYFWIWHKRNSSFCWEFLQVGSCYFGKTPFFKYKGTKHNSTIRKIMFGNPVF